MRLLKAGSLILCGTLSACATPQEHCFRGVNKDIITVNRLIQSVSQNIKRGYAIEKTQVQNVIPSRCKGRDANGKIFTFSCEKTDITDVERPVAIDLKGEQEKLVSLQQRHAKMQQRYNQDIASCIATHPST